MRTVIDRVYAVRFVKDDKIPTATPDVVGLERRQLVGCDDDVIALLEGFGDALGAARSHIEKPAMKADLKHDR